PLLRLALLLLRADHDEIEDGEDRAHLDEEPRHRRGAVARRGGHERECERKGHGTGSGLEWWRASQSRLHASNAPAAIAARASRRSDTRKCTLCRDSRRRPSISSAVKRWRRYARLKRAHVEQAHASSRGRLSARSDALRTFRRPSRVNAVPLRPMR